MMNDDDRPASASPATVALLDLLDQDLEDEDGDFISLTPEAWEIVHAFRAEHGRGPHAGPLGPAPTAGFAQRLAAWKLVGELIERAHETIHDTVGLHAVVSLDELEKIHDVLRTAPARDGTLRLEPAAPGDPPIRGSRPPR